MFSLEKKESGQEVGAARGLSIIIMQEGLNKREEEKSPPEVPLCLRATVIIILKLA